MPAYTYRCNKCGQFDFVKPMSASNLTECPTCGESIKRIYTVPNTSNGANSQGSSNPVYDPRKSALWNSAQME